MDAQGHRDRDVDRHDPCQRYRGLPIRKRLLVAAVDFVARFVVFLGPFFALEYFFGIPGDQRGDVVGSLAEEAERSALLSALFVVSYPLQCRLQRRIGGNERQRR